MEITYTRKGDYLYPNLFMPVEEPVSLGKYGRMRKSFLKEHRTGLYTELLLNGKLNHHLAQIDEAAYQAFDRLVDQMAKAEGVTEKLKAQDQMQWVQRMNSIHDRADEIVLNEYVYC